jgi:hypothetical protein
VQRISVELHVYPGREAVTPWALLPVAAAIDKALAGIAESALGRPPRRDARVGAEVFQPTPPRVTARLFVGGSWDDEETLREALRLFADGLARIAAAPTRMGPPPGWTHDVLEGVYNDFEALTSTIGARLAEFTLADGTAFAYCRNLEMRLRSALGRRWPIVDPADSDLPWPPVDVAAAKAEPWPDFFPPLIPESEESEGDREWEAWMRERGRL